MLRQISIWALLLLTVNSASAAQEKWTRASSPVSIRLHAVTHAANVFVAIGDRGTILSSDDGTGWSRQSSGTSASLKAITYGNGRFLIAGDSGTVLTSPNGVTWKKQTLKFSVDLTAATFGAGRFVIGGSFAPIVSEDGTTWIPDAYVVQIFPINSVCYFNGLFALAGAEQNYQTSPDGQTWTCHSHCLDLPDGMPYGTWFGMAASERRIVQVGEHRSYREFYNTKGGVISYSDNGIDWRLPDSIPADADTVFAVACGNGAFVTAGAGGQLLSSPDGRVWSAMESGVHARLSGIACGNDLFVTVGDSGIILSSPSSTRISKTNHDCRPAATPLIINNNICRYSVDITGKATLRLFDLKGNVAITLADHLCTPGTYSTAIPALLSPGRYIVSFKSKNSVFQQVVDLFR